MKPKKPAPKKGNVAKNIQKAVMPKPRQARYDAIIDGASGKKKRK
jgi:hypothetical protein